MTNIVGNILLIELMVMIAALGTLAIIMLFKIVKDEFK